MYTMTLISFAVGRYLRKVTHERSGLHSHSRTHHPRSKPWEDHMLLSDSNTSEVCSGHVQHLYALQSVLSHDVEGDSH